MAAATGARISRRPRDVECPGGRPTRLPGAFTGCGHDQSHWDRALRPEEGRPGHAQLQPAAQPCVGMAGLAAGRGR
jgi:hypothetical protein